MAWRRGKRGSPGLRGRLLDTSIEAYILALETISRLSVTYRVEALAYLICNVWELLLKATIISDANGDRSSVLRKAKPGRRPESLPLRECYHRVFANRNDRKRHNPELLADPRDDVVHLVIGQVPKAVMGLFQASVRNYHSRLGKGSGLSLSDRVPLTMVTPVYDLGPDQMGLGNSVLRRRLAMDAAEYLTAYQGTVRQQAEDLGRPAQFSVDVCYRLALVMEPSDTDIVLSQGPGGSPVGPVPAPRDPALTHHHYEKHVVSLANAAPTSQAQTNCYDLQCVVKGT